MTREELIKDILLSPAQAIRIYVILREDAYETTFGDGYYGYFETAFTSEEAAVKCLKQKQSEADEFTKYHINFTEASLNNGELVFRSNFSPFESVDTDIMIAHLE